jgi:hypothetical protein
MEVLMRLKIAGEPATFTLQGDTFQWRTKYNPDLVADMRLEIPNTAKAWHNGGRDDRYWTISADYFEKAKELSTRHGYEVVITGGTLNQLKPGSHTFDLDYMGLVRDRSDGTQTATGWVNGYWNAVFKLDVLQEWFNFNAKPNVAASLYEVLSLQQGLSGALFDKALKKAYRRYARTWHPDVCKEPEADEAFKRGQEAYERLSDPLFKAKYDAGLKFERDYPVEQGNWKGASIQWKPPVRCGKLTVLGLKVGDKYDIHKIVQWRDITNDRGETMISFWDISLDKFVTEWRA